MNSIILTFLFIKNKVFNYTFKSVKLLLFYKTPFLFFKWLKPVMVIRELL